MPSFRTADALVNRLVTDRTFFHKKNYNKNFSDLNPGAHSLLLNSAKNCSFTLSKKGRFSQVSRVISSECFISL